MTGEDRYYANSDEGEINRLREQVRIATEALGTIVHIGDGCEVEGCHRILDPATLAEDALIRMLVVE